MPFFAAGFLAGFFGTATGSAGMFFSALRSIGIFVVGYGLTAPKRRSAATRIESGEPEKLQTTASASLVVPSRYGKLVTTTTVWPASFSALTRCRLLPRFSMRA